MSELAFKAVPWRDTAERDIKRLQAVLAQRTKAQQAKCEHKRVAECAYEPSQYSTSLPPSRICLHCRMTEVGWGPGFNTLRGERGYGILEIERSRLYRERRGLAIQDHHKGPLLRREVTVAQLVESGGELPPDVAERERNWGA